LETLDLVCREVAQATTLPCKLSGLYGALKPWLLQEYEKYLLAADPILEGPTLRILAQIVREERLQIAWGKEWLTKQVENDWSARDQAEQWRLRLVRCLDDLDNVKSMVNGPAAPNQSLMHFTGQPPACDPRLDIVYYTPGQGPSAPVAFDPRTKPKFSRSCFQPWWWWRQKPLN
jgi:hypothetical protein